MIPRDQDSTAQAQPARAGGRQRQQGLPGEGLQPPAVLRDPPELPDLWRRRPARQDRRRAATHPNRVAEEVEQAILDHCLAHPCHGALRVANELALAALQVSSTGVRGVWSRHGLLSRHDRLLRLEKASAEPTFTLTDEQIEALERFSPEFRERHIEAHYTGDLLAVDTFSVGSLKGVGKVYLQSAIDCCSRYGWGRF